MAYLYLNFIDNLEDGSRKPNDVYNSSLNEQYEMLMRKVGGNHSGTLQSFISSFCPLTKSNYYISLPSFDRRICTFTSKSGRESKYISNIIIRPAKNRYNVLPDNYDLILIGDVMFGSSVISVCIKGIDIIDSSIEKFGEIPVECTVACAFSKKTLSNGALVADYGGVSLNDSVVNKRFC